MAALDRRIVAHFDWTVLVLSLGLAGAGLVSVLTATGEIPGTGWIRW